MPDLEKTAHRYFSPLQKLAIVSAYEHYTAILGDFLLRAPSVLAAAPQDLSLVWEWHAAEETEHKAVCFDLYQAAGGSWWLRSLALLLVTIEFFVIFLGLYCNMLWHAPRYFSPGFHPWKQDNWQIGWHAIMRV